MLYVYGWLHRAGEMIRYPRCVFQRFTALWCGYQEMNLGPLEEQQEILPVELSLQPLNIIFLLMSLADIN